MPAPTGALDAGLGPDFPCCIAALAFFPYLAKIALECARTSPAVERSGTPVVDVHVLTGKRAADVTDRQRLWFLNVRHYSWTSLVTRGVHDAPASVLRAV